jgi:hypothetical protein
MGISDEGDRPHHHTPLIQEPIRPIQNICQIFSCREEIFKGLISKDRDPHEVASEEKKEDNQDSH